MPQPHKTAMWTLWSCYWAQFRGDLVLCLFPQWHLQALHLLTSVNTEQSVPGGWYPIEGQVSAGSSGPAVHRPWTMATVFSHPASCWVMRHSVRLWCYHTICCPLPLPSPGLTPGCLCSHHSLSPALTTVSLFLSFSPPDLSTGYGGQQGLCLVSSSLRIQHSFVWHGTVCRFDLREHKPKLGPMDHLKRLGPSCFPWVMTP